MITQLKWDSLKKVMQGLSIYEDDITEKFIRGSGSGGQKLNKTSSCVQLIYKKIEIKCQKTRSQADNRFWARRELCDRILQERSDINRNQKSKIEKIRRQKRKKSQRSKNKMLYDKAHQSEKKKLRRKVQNRDV